MSRLAPGLRPVPPLAIGISEHHMNHKGTLSAKPGSWLAVLFDAVESLARHGLQNILILNGHGGNTAPVLGVIDQWRLYFRLHAPSLNLQFACYWDWVPPEMGAQHLAVNVVPGHAREFETSIALALFPENVRRAAMEDQVNKEPLRATAEKGRIFVGEVVRRVADFVQGMIEGRNRPPEVRHYP